MNITAASSPPLTPATRTSVAALTFAVAGSRYALPVEVVVEVTRAATVTSPTGKESTLLGYVDLRGEAVPVVTARSLLGLGDRPLLITDRFVVIRLGARQVVIVVDRVEGVGEVTDVEAREGPDGAGLAVGRMSSTGAGDELVIVIDPDRIVPGSVHARLASEDAR